MQRHQRTDKFHVYSYLFYALGCIGLIALALVANSRSEHSLQIAQADSSLASTTLSKARQLINSNFDFEEERQLTNLVSKSSLSHDLDKTSVKVVSLNKTVLDRLFEGKKVRAKLDIPALAVKSDIEHAWLIIGHSVEDKKAYSKGGLEQFKQALEAYEKGISLKQFPADERGNSYLKEASTKFVKILKSQPPSVVKEYSLYFLGDIGFRLWDENQDLPGLAYMIELIRFTENSELAQKAWLKLNAQVHFGYTGSGGDHTPADWRRFLAQLQGLTYKDRNFPLMSRISP